MSLFDASRVKGLFAAAGSCCDYLKNAFTPKSSPKKGISLFGALNSMAALDSVGERIVFLSSDISHAIRIFPEKMSAHCVEAGLHYSDKEALLDGHSEFIDFLAASVPAFDASDPTWFEDEAKKKRLNNALKVACDALVSHDKLLSEAVDAYLENKANQKALVENKVFVDGPTDDATIERIQEYNTKIAEALHTCLSFARAAVPAGQKEFQRRIEPLHVELSKIAPKRPEASDAHVSPTPVPHAE